MFTNVVVGLKPGVASEPLLELVRSVVAPGGKIHLVTFVKVATEDDEPARIRGTEERLDRTGASLRSEGFEVSFEADLYLHGAGSQLVGIAEERSADLIIIGMGRRSRVGKALLGSDAQSLLLQAGCPVLATRIHE